MTKLTYDTARTVTRALGLKTQQAYHEWYAQNRSDAVKLGLYAQPETAYRSQKSWVSWSDYLDADISVRSRLRKFKTYDEAKLYMRAFNLRSSSDYAKWATSENRLDGHLPNRPDQYYKRQGTWVSWEDFLGYETVPLLGWEDFKSRVIKARYQGAVINSMKAYNAWWQALPENERCDLPITPWAYYGLHWKRFSQW